MRTGRASLSLLEGVTVDYYGTPVPLNQVANLSVADASMIVAQPFDPQPDLGHRAGDHEVRPGPQPVVGRQGDPHPGAAADRGPPQGDRQEGPRPRRARPQRRPPGAPRGQRQAQEEGEGQARSARTTSAAAWTRSRSSTTTTSPRSPPPCRRKSSRSWRSEGGAAPQPIGGASAGRPCQIFDFEIELEVRHDLGTLGGDLSEILVRNVLDRESRRRFSDATRTGMLLPFRNSTTF